MDAAVSAAREKLKNVTPLKNDCGRVCGARCCRPLDGEETGMLLFPGEAGRPGHLPRNVRPGRATAFLPAVPAAPADPG